MSVIIAIIVFLCQFSPVDYSFVVELMMRESGGDIYAIGDLDRAHTSVGPYQYQPDTYEWLFEESTGLTLDWSEEPRTDPVQTTYVTIKALEEGYAWLWSVNDGMRADGWTETQDGISVAPWAQLEADRWSAALE